MSLPDVLVIGAGLSGLRVAEGLTRDGRSVVLLEARDRVGGRVLTETVGGVAVDLGPAWFWPGQPRMAALIATLGLTPFEQHATGDALSEDARGMVRRGPQGGSMAGAWRLRGGLGALTGGLAAALPDGTLRLNAPVARLEQSAGGIRATTVGGGTVLARRAVLAIPPRLAARIAFAPDLPDAALRAMEAVPTWMAGQAKAVAIYEHPFWRARGLSGDAMSRRGPLVEIHDASPAGGGPGALFGFVGVPPGGRGALVPAVTAQLARLFGAEAARPRAVRLFDWAAEPWTATERDLAPLAAHPRYGRPPALVTLWDGALMMAGTELADGFGGFLDGALEAAETCLAAFARERT